MTTMDDPYRAPQAEVLETDVNAEADYYVVAPFKFLLLMVGTFGLYSIYWFYRHWAALNRRGGGYLPVLRAIFSVLFTHALFAEIAATLKRRQPAYAFAPGTMATIYVLASILSHVANVLIRKELLSPAIEVASNLLMVPIIWALYVAQKAANAACGDTEGKANSIITGANIAWLVVGGLFWLLALVGSYVMLVEGTLD